jgi:hypothetical protein
VVKGKSVFLWNLVDLKRVRWEGPVLSPGKHTLEFDFKYEGLGMGTLAFNNFSGLGRGGTGVLKVDGNVVSTEKMDHTLPFLLQFDENFDVGADTGSPVNDAGLPGALRVHRQAQQVDADDRPATTKPSGHKTPAGKCSTQQSH